MADQNEAAFWRERYQTGRTGWDLGSPSPNLQRLVKEHVAAGEHLFVPGCGRGYDAVAFAKGGYRVTALDIADEAIAEAEAKAREQGAEVTWVSGDLFAPRPEWEAAFDAWAELTCFCAVDPSRRDDYVQTAAAWLKPGGLVIAVIFCGIGEGGPPFDSTPDELEARFTKHFDILHAGWSPDSVEGRQGKEWEMVMRRR